MNMKLVNHGESGELFIEGRLDTNTTPEAEEVFQQMMERFQTLTLNMEKLEYVSSAGLRALKRLHVGMAKKGGVLELKQVNRMVMEVFEMTGFAGLLKFV